jgi:hypothetical protein
MLAMAITEMSVRNLVVITPSAEKRSDCSQWLYDEAGNVIDTHEHAGEFKEPYRLSPFRRIPLPKCRIIRHNSRVQPFNRFPLATARNRLQDAV